MGLFKIKEKVKRLVYKLKIPNDWIIYLIFLIAQLEPAFELFDNLFWCFHLHHPPAVFVKSDTNCFKSFEINCLLNKRTMKWGKSLTVEYLICWAGYKPEWDMWYNVKNLNNIAKLVCKYKESLA